MGAFNRRQLTLTATGAAVVLLFGWSWKQSQIDHAKVMAEIHAAGLDHCPAQALTHWRGEMICDKFYVDNPSVMTPSELGGQRLYDERPRPEEFRK